MKSDKFVRRAGELVAQKAIELARELNARPLSTNEKVIEDLIKVIVGISLYTTEEERLLSRTLAERLERHARTLMDIVEDLVPGLHMEDIELPILDEVGLCDMCEKITSHTRLYEVEDKLICSRCIPVRIETLKSTMATTLRLQAALEEAESERDWLKSVMEQVRERWEGQEEENDQDNDD